MRTCKRPRRTFIEYFTQVNIVRNRRIEEARLKYAEIREYEDEEEEENV